MTKQIKSIKTLNNKREFTVYVNFDNGTYGTHTKNKETGKWFDGGLKAEELTEAKKIALVNGKWTNWTRKSHSATSQPETFENMPVTEKEQELINRNQPRWSEENPY